jgi:hypothetical protein
MPPAVTRPDLPKRSGRPGAIATDRTLFILPLLQESGLAAPVCPRGVAVGLALRRKPLCATFMR